MEVLKNKDIEDGKRIADIFATLSEENKNMAIVYARYSGLQHPTDTQNAWINSNQNTR